MTGHDVAEKFVTLTDREKDIKRAKNKHFGIN